MKALKIRFLLPCLAILALVIGGLLQTPDDTYETLVGDIFATHYKITYRSGASLELNPQAIQAAIDKELKRIDWIASTWKEESELSRYNRAQDKKAFPLSEDLATLLEQSREIKLRTGGAFDIEYKKGTLDLSGIAKGYAVDQIASYLGVTLGIDSFLVDIGGEVKAQGVNSKGEVWRVGIFIPPSYASIPSPQIELEDTSIATTGRYFKGDHITDPAKGAPVTHSLISTSVIAPSNTTADALATALYVMGIDQGIDWARRHQVKAIFILDDGTVIRSFKPKPDRKDKT